MNRERKITPGEVGLLSSARKFVGSRFGVWPRHCALIAAMAALLLLPIEASDAGWLSDVFKGSSKQGKSPKHVASAKPATPAKHAAAPKPRTTKSQTAKSQTAKPHTVKLAALGPAAFNPSAVRPAATTCDPAKFRIVLD